MLPIKPQPHDCPQQDEALRKAAKIEYLPIFFLMGALFFLPKGPADGAMQSLAIVFVSIVLEAIPFMFLGSLAGGCIEVLVNRDRFAAWCTRKGWLTVCAAAGAGLIFPVCECAVVPVLRRLTGKGLPFSAAIAYLLGGPIVNPIVALSTALAYSFDWRIVLLRLAGGYGIAVAIALGMGRLFQSRPALLPSYQHQPSDHPAIPMACSCHQHDAQQTGWEDKAGSAVKHALHDFLAVGHYLIIGAFLAALAQTFLDRSLFINIAGGMAVPVVLMMTLAVALNLCSEADAFIAASFRGLLPEAAQMAFMLTGPMFDIKLLLMYQSVFTRQAIVALVAAVLSSVLCASLLLGWLFG